MAKFYKRSAGSFGFRQSAGEEAALPLPGDVVDAVAFDEDANAALVADIMAGASLYTLTAGVLKKSGVTVTPGADGDLAVLRGAATAAVAGNDAYLAVASPSNAQVGAQVRALTQQSTRLIKAMLKLL